MKWTESTVFDCLPALLFLFSRFIFYVKHCTAFALVASGCQNHLEAFISVWGVFWKKKSPCDSRKCCHLSVMPRSLTVATETGSRMLEKNSCSQRGKFIFAQRSQGPPTFDQKWSLDCFSLQSFPPSREFLASDLTYRPCCSYHTQYVTETSRKKQPV